MDLKRPHTRSNYLDKLSTLRLDPTQGGDADKYGCPLRYVYTADVALTGICN
ncbi:MAG: hypothetical protein LBP35_06575 [Candidatus Ancillula trichonymphae]|nr:hypothetical protein [Candidatus Ancillula trichonymphae]